MLTICSQSQSELIYVHRLCRASSFPALLCVRQTFNIANSRQGVTRPIWRELCLHHKNAVSSCSRAPQIGFLGPHRVTTECFQFFLSTVVKIFWMTFRHAASLKDRAWLVVMRIKKSATSNLDNDPSPPPRSITTKDFFKTETWESFSGVKTSPFESYDTNMYRAENQKGFADDDKSLLSYSRGFVVTKKKEKRTRMSCSGCHCAAITTSFRLLYNYVGCDRKQSPDSRM